MVLHYECEDIETFEQKRKPCYWDGYCGHACKVNRKHWISLFLKYIPLCKVYLFCSLLNLCYEQFLMLIKIFPSL